jgi:uracil phosphoribosyltransferase/phosphoserine phosphatase/adenylate kinase
MPLHEQELSAGLTSHVADQLSTQSPSNSESNLATPTVIGIYGIPGSGKTFLLEQLKQDLLPTSFHFYEGSEVIANLVPGGLVAFQEMNSQDKTRWREQAIDAIRKQSQGNGKTAVVTGHFMFWPEVDKEGDAVYTNNDMNTYTHILYLDIPVQTIEQRRWNDVSRPRPHTSVAHLLKWQRAEKSQLQALCREHGILFSVLQSDRTVKSRALELLRDFRVHTEKYNEAQAQAKLDAIMASYRVSPDTMLVIDGDRTLAAQDTGVLFWKKLSDEGRKAGDDPLKVLFSGPMGYSYKAFRQAMLLYEDAVDVETYDTICQHVASKIILYPEFQSLLRLIAQQENIGAAIVSCGIRGIWEKVVDKAGFSKSVSVIAGGRISDGFVVTAETKAAVVTRLQTLHHAYVWAFGDSPLDLKMLKTADEAVVVVGDELTRSKTMDVALLKTIDDGGLRARQVMLPPTVSPRLDIHKLTIAVMNGIDFISDLLRRPDQSAKFAIYHATNKQAAKLIATPMRDAAVAGPALRKAHREAGWYLSYEFLTHIIGVEDCPISHVLRHTVTGSRLLDEQQTTIVAVMRAGEPMASGVSEAFPLAMYVHAKNPSDLTPHHVQGRSQIVLVDSVINSGKTVIEFVQHIRSFGADIRVVVVAGVVQGECVSPSSATYKALEACGNVSLVALRISSTKFTGSGTTDTGNRLFNSTHIL